MDEWGILLLSIQTRIDSTVYAFFHLENILGVFMLLRALQ